MVLAPDLGPRDGKSGSKEEQAQKRSLTEEIGCEPVVVVASPEETSSQSKASPKKIVQSPEKTVPPTQGSGRAEPGGASHLFDLEFEEATAISAEKRQGEKRKRVPNEPEQTEAATTHKAKKIGKAVGNSTSIGNGRAVAKAVSVEDLDSRAADATEEVPKKQRGISDSVEKLIPVVMAAPTEVLKRRQGLSDSGVILRKDEMKPPAKKKGTEKERPTSVRVSSKPDVPKFAVARQPVVAIAGLDQELKCCVFRTLLRLGSCMASDPTTTISDPDFGVQLRINNLDAGNLKILDTVIGVIRFVATSEAARQCFVGGERSSPQMSSRADLPLETELSLLISFMMDGFQHRSAGLPLEDFVVSQRGLAECFSTSAVEIQAIACALYGLQQLKSLQNILFCGSPFPETG